MKLKEMYEQMKDRQDQPQVNIEQVKGNFDKQITKFKSLGKVLYNLGKYKQIAQYFDSLAQNAEHYLVSKSDTWFDNITIKRNTKELKTYAKEFAKVAGEAQALQQRMLTLYEDMGVILNRYFDVPDEQMEGMGEMGIGEEQESPVGMEEEAYYRKHKQAEVDSLDEMAKSKIKKGHEIAKAIKKSGSKVKNPYAVGMATAKKMDEEHEPLNTHAGSPYYRLRTQQGMSHEEAVATINKSKQGKVAPPVPPEKKNNGY